MFPGKIKFFALLAFVEIGLIPLTSQAEEGDRRLSVFTRNDGGQIHFFVRNTSQAPVTTTVEMSTENFRGTVAFPHTFAVGPNETCEAFALTMQDVNQPWSYHFTNYSTLGRCDAVPDTNHIYELPFAPGSEFNVSQGFHGKFSHCGPDEYAIDFQMPEGTPVHAARGGVVIAVNDSHWEGGPDKRWEQCANSILIQHHDGTVGIYGHLMESGGKVKVGETVLAGQLIAMSGNTGFTSGPHLHFAVFRPKNGRERESLPIQFFTGNHGVTAPQTGVRYTSTAPVVDPLNAPKMVKRSELLASAF